MSVKRKNDHLDLAKESQVSHKRFELNYEPLLSAHPDENTDIGLSFAGAKLNAGIWFSSMTGGADHALTINKNLAKVAGKYNLGMGLGSCRPLLESDKRLADFDVKEFMPDSPLYSNLGIAQLEKIVLAEGYDLLLGLQKKLNADGLIIHINPLQEWAQKEGDRLTVAPLKILKKLLEDTDIPVAIKEVGQGLGPKSLEELIKLPIKFIEFAALGGTNFTKLEQTRHLATASGKTLQTSDLAYIGHTKEEMISILNSLDKSLFNCKDFIISGGIQSSIEGFEYMQKLNHNSVLGFGSKLLDYATDEILLDEFIHSEIENLKLASCYFEGNK